MLICGLMCSGEFCAPNLGFGGRTVNIKRLRPPRLGVSPFYAALWNLVRWFIKHFALRRIPQANTVSLASQERAVLSRTSRKWDPSNRDDPRCRSLRRNPFLIVG